MALAEVDDREGHFSRSYLVLSFLVGSSYLIFSMFQFLEGAGVPVPFASTLNVPGDMAAGFVLLITGILLAAGGVVGSRGEGDGSGFIMVGYFMGSFLAAVQILILLSTMATTSLSGEGSVDPALISGGIVPGLYMVLPLLLLSSPVMKVLIQLENTEKKEAKP